MKLVKDRESIILPLCKGKDVLDIGCVGQAESYGHPRWLYGKICGVATSCIGVDIQHEEVKKLQRLGFNVAYGNAETMNLNKKFDVIVAGEIVEHVSNQGLFLENMKRHLKRDGMMALTTPNALCPAFILWHLFRKTAGINPEHVVWHSEGTLRSLAKRHGWRIKKIYYEYPKIWWKKLFASVMSHLVPPEFVSIDLIAILAKNDKILN